HGHLGGADEDEVVALVAAVRLLLAAGEVARADHHLAADERRHRHRHEALRDHAVEREAHHRALEQREVALQEVVARARDPRAAPSFLLAVFWRLRISSIATPTSRTSLSRARIASTSTAMRFFAAPARTAPGSARMNLMSSTRTTSRTIRPCRTACACRRRVG